MNPLASRIWQHGRDRQTPAAGRVLRVGSFVAVAWLALVGWSSQAQHGPESEQVLVAAPDALEWSLQPAHLRAGDWSECPSSEAVVTTDSTRSNEI